MGKKTGVPVISLKGISYRYRNVTALENITFCVHQGERIALLGANGSGKSTLLKILDGLIFPTGGTLEYSGEAISRQYLDDEQREYKFRRKIGYVFQDSDVQLFSATVWDEVTFAPLHMGLAKAEVIKRADNALDFMGITSLKDRVPHLLSGGEKKKVAIASVLSYQPEVWLFDEPTAGLDPRSQSRLIDFICSLDRKCNTVITATHDLYSVGEISDRILVLSEDHAVVADSVPGKILADRALLTQHNLIHDHIHPHQKKQHSHIHSPVSSHRH